MDQPWSGRAVHTYNEMKVWVSCTNDRDYPSQQIHSFSIDQPTYHHNSHCVQHQQVMIEQ